jgi:predicted DNA-binding protein (MmcQ/YjbR family)
MNKRHWISIELDGSVPDDEIDGLITNSWRLVAQGLTRAQRTMLDIHLDE